MNKKLCITLIVLLICLSDICFIKLYKGISEDKRQAQQFESIAVAIDEAENGEDKFSSLYQQNNDFVGWISIPDTKIDYPVVQSKSNPDYYLNHNFNKEYSRFGVPFVQENCSIETSDNIIIYGHNMRNKTMFNELVKYEDIGFYAEHNIIYFDTENEERDYVIIAVFKTVANSGNGFAFNDFVEFNDEEEFDIFIDKCKYLALYETGISAKYGDKLLTLCTCEYSREDGRLIVLAKKV